MLFIVLLLVIIGFLSFRLTVLYFENHRLRFSLKVGENLPSINLTAKNSREFTQSKFEGDGKIGGEGGIYTFVGSKNMDLFYKHDPKKYFSNIVCFTPLKPSELLYSGKDDMIAINSDYCVPLYEDLLKDLRKNSVSDVQERGDTTKDYFEGSVNALVTGYTIDTRGMETYYNITLEKINEVYR